MGLFDRFKSKKKENDAEFFGGMEAMIAEMKEKEGTMFEELPNAQGEFGFSVNNPIPFIDLASNRNYLENLIYIKPGASRYEWKRSGAVRSEIVSAPVDKYDLLDTDGTIIKSIYTWSYNKVNSTKVPEGFGLMDA